MLDAHSFNLHTLPARLGGVIFKETFMQKHDLANQCQNSRKFMEENSELTNKQAEAFLDDWNENNAQLKKQRRFHIKVK